MIVEHFHEFVYDLYNNNKFYKLFFHWSWQVRNMFYYFILFILNHRIKNITYPKFKGGRRFSDTFNKKDNNYAENVN